MAKPPNAAGMIAIICGIVTWCVLSFVLHFDDKLSFAVALIVIVVVLVSLIRKYPEMGKRWNEQD